MRSCVDKFGGVLLFNYDIKGVILSIGAREAFSKKERSGLRVSIRWAGCAGPTRGSAENNSRVTLARPVSDPLLAGHELTRTVPVSFSSTLNPT